MLKNKRVCLFANLIIFAAATVANAGLFEDIRTGLAISGYQQQLSHNPVSNGWDYTFSQNFDNTVFGDTTFNFGVPQLTLNGTLQGSFSIGNAGIPTYKLHLETPVGLSYQFFSSDGPTRLSVDDGIFNIQADIMINKYGGYDIRIPAFTNRGTLVISNDNTTREVPLDFDIGPINIHGHWLVDLVNATLGEQFGFTLPGGGTNQIVAGFSEQILKAYEDEAKGVLSLNVVPEPACMVLLLLGGFFVFRRR